VIRRSVPPSNLRGSCREGDPVVLFFHPDGERGAARALREVTAKGVRARCPVLSQYRTHALRAREPYGVWGLSKNDREEMLGARRRACRSDG
jgi:WhiB family transcriptional regulator, redox-sensing transcriptional regulator